MRIFLAGATGAIGRRLTPLLVAAGHQVTGTTRSADKAAALKAQGAQAVVVDVFDRQALGDAVVAARAEVVIHQLTDLPQVLDPARRGEALVRNAKLRIDGTANLVAAAQAAGARRLISQSIAFIYAEGPEPHAESDPLAPADGDDLNALTARGVRALEGATLDTPGIGGIVLRYGRLYGPGTWFAQASGRGPLHVDAAAQAASLAVTRGDPGIYNIAEDDGAVTTDKARRDLGFDPAFRLPA
ncbi:MAG TPA: NAD(P)-dependent oxidoreductase [Xanthobacteraceae bacterium]|nr:NAD(P)-dependent oxidoreductase [Xanthobacteraceae bacterium]